MFFTQGISKVPNGAWMDGCFPSVAFYRLVSNWFQMGKLVSTRSRKDMFLVKLMVNGSFGGKGAPHEKKT